MDLKKLKAYKSKDEESKFEELNHNNTALLHLIQLCIFTSMSILHKGSVEIKNTLLQHLEHSF